MTLRRALLVLLLVVAAGAAVAHFYVAGRVAAPKYRLGRVERGPLTANVATTGTLSAVITVQVGTQVSGRVKEIFVDFNSAVKKGQVIARIDPESFEAKLTQAKAQLESARALVLNQRALMERTRADIANARATLAATRAQISDSDAQLLEAKRQLERRVELLRKDLIAPSEKDSAQAGYDSAAARLEAARAQALAQQEAIRAAEAQLRVAEALLQSAVAQVADREAALRQAQVDLENTRIAAPVDGVVVSRNVDVGQTVAAAFQAPVLFNIAQDLTQMQVHTHVDEADVGRVRVGQRGTFTVDAFRGRTFAGQVVQVRKAAQVVQNVVTYTVVMSAPNPSLTLLPGMTANVSIAVDHRESALKIPNAALRFRPDEPEPSREGSGQTAAEAADDGAWARRMREQLGADLGLDDSQARKIGAVIERSERDVRALSPQRMSTAERAQRRRIIEEAAWAEIRGLLTPDQRSRYDAAVAAPGPGTQGALGQVWLLDPDGQLRPVRVRLGISDGQFTEVLEGAMAEGQGVVVGAVDSPATKPTRGSRLRL